MVRAACSSYVRGGRETESLDVGVWAVQREEGGCGKKDTEERSEVGHKGMVKV